MNYAHDYTRPSKVAQLLSKALRSNCGDARDIIEEAAILLDQYLANDNYIKDEIL